MNTHIINTEQNDRIYHKINNKYTIVRRSNKGENGLAWVDFLMDGEDQVSMGYTNSNLGEIEVYKKYMENLKKWNKNYLKKSIEERREIREKNAWEATLPGWGDKQVFNIGQIREGTEPKIDSFIPGMVKVIKDSILTISEDEKDIIEYYFILDQQAIDWLKNNGYAWYFIKDETSSNISKILETNNS